MLELKARVATPSVDILEKLTSGADNFVIPFEDLVRLSIFSVQLYFDPSAYVGSAFIS